MEEKSQANFTHKVNPIQCLLLANIFKQDVVS